MITRTDSSGSRTFITDALGSTIGLADTSGTVQTQYSYGAFGLTTSSGAASSNSFQFTGRENDGTGLYDTPAVGITTQPLSALSRRIPWAYTVVI